VTRILAALFALLLIGSAAAQPPVDYILLCGAEVVGTASYVDDEFHVALLEGAEECAGDVIAMSVVGDEVLAVTIAPTDDGLGLVVTFGDELEGVIADVVPQPAIDGMVGAAENRAAAGQGEETAAAMREAHQPEPPVLPDAAGGRP
jgi:hypothetical protein